MGLLEGEEIFVLT